ncbi:hypothetical protein [Thalassotalea euphylliae]|uniref:Uncharacterized protein n=1 Tax=Thalassotalea euphylliae TaxID=1655234 RepID=A0A3E0U6B1_9GAMM|nr:hypothetical protein [Thalassotalea euphylliae]REL32521.1 hypothetical protein DXX94_18395 [Thalassotalea euphylliae]
MALRSEERIREGRRARLRAEVYHALDNKPIEVQCIYLRPEQRNQFMRGWQSVSLVDIHHAIKRAKQQREKSCL